MRIESEYKIDTLRLTQPVPPDKPATYNTGGFFNNFNAGKHSFLLNMNAEGARAVAYRLVERSDVFLTNHTPRVVAKWGVDYPSLRAVNPRIVAAYQPMQGSTGPHRDFLGFGAVLTPISGPQPPERRPGAPPDRRGHELPRLHAEPRPHADGHPGRAAAPRADRRRSDGGVGADRVGGGDAGAGAARLYGERPRGDAHGATGRRGWRRTACSAAATRRGRTRRRWGRTRTCGSAGS